MFGVLRAPTFLKEIMMKEKTITFNPVGADLARYREIEEQVSAANMKCGGTCCGGDYKCVCEHSENYGVIGFKTADEAIAHAKTFFDDFMILYCARKKEFAWAWPREYGASMINNLIVEIAQ